MPNNEEITVKRELLEVLFRLAHDVNSFMNKKEVYFAGMRKINHETQAMLKKHGII